MTSTRTILFAGGGSGGHLTPGLAVAEELLRRDPHCEMIFAGSSRSIEQTVLAESTVHRASLPVVSTGALKSHPFRFAAGMIGNIRQALRLMDRWRPEKVVGLGGFASVPVAIAATRRGVPLILLEQNVIPGRATRLLSRSAALTCLSFDETRRHLPRNCTTVVTGNPVRREIRVLQSLPKTGSGLIVLGGSQGAAGVNAAASEAIIRLKRHLHDRPIIHQTGERDRAFIAERYREAGIHAEVEAYLRDVASHYSDAAVAISRAGATTLAELALARCPALLVPYPGAIRDHQQHNADHFARAGGALIVNEGTDTTERLARSLATLLLDPQKRNHMSQSIAQLAKPKAANAVAECILPSKLARAA